MSICIRVNEGQQEFDTYFDRSASFNDMVLFFFSKIFDLVVLVILKPVKVTKLKSLAENEFTPEK